MLRDFIGTRTHGLLFCTSTSGQLLQANTLQDSLHPILKKLHHEKGGFNIFRRFRITYLNNSDCPEKLQHFWSGHAQTHVSERYLKLMKPVNIAWNGQSNSVRDSHFLPKLAYLAYQCL